MKYNYNYNSFKQNTSCCSQTTGYRGQGNWQSVCCTGSNPGNISDFASYCCKDSSGNAKAGGQNAVCCSGTGNDFCCNQSVNHCTCSQKYARYSSGYWGRTKNAYTSAAAEGCCTGPSRITGSDWVAGCCSEKYYASGKGSNEGKDCCRILYNNSTIRNKVFSVGGGCCDILGVNSETGKDSTGTYYPECQLTCFKESTYSTSTKYTPSSVAKDCCAGSGKGLVQTASNWQKYCCGMTDSTHSWSFPTTSSDKRCCDKRYSSRTGVYAYDPYYMDNACPAGDNKNKCASYGYAPFGFYCGNENKCLAWQSYPSDANLTDTEKANCCNGWGSNPPAALKDECCRVKSDLSYCSGCSVSSGTHISIDCVRIATTSSYGSTTPAANSNTIKCSVSGGNVTVSFGFKKTNGTNYGGAVNSGSSATFSGIKAITSVSINHHGSYYFSTGYSPSLISDYNEYNAEVTILNDNNISCRYSKYENNCYKFAGPQKCSYSSSCTQEEYHSLAILQGAYIHIVQHKHFQI